MSKYDEIIQDIVDACRKNVDLFKIVKDISQMEINKRYKIRKNASKFLKRENGIDKEAMKFYFIITEDGIAEEVLRRIKVDES
ncbi:hypothetical protein [Petrotoga sp. 9PWA.NaAc.5.4]|uniref:hypothetical protein n=1 Tax=Petrotoga sp. 9PWA.NaAc.5.4 TaxID=1434328 RepID=UPI000CAF6AAD|nr:hypothetical protein [Petrotoga sp. 9PWA.NaAc.5.4]PNR95803.1 hypothetical protein X924_03870 [Petrotoga sp. 9PWA.NaAc.5.4]